uniref:Uncharacterized protein n=1 Tax=Arundo donax TaxID=35708 RepID=A0A0A9B6G9_ARUDO
MSIYVVYLSIGLANSFLSCHLHACVCAILQLRL